MREKTAGQAAYESTIPLFAWSELSIPAQGTWERIARVAVERVHESIHAATEMAAEMLGDEPWFQSIGIRGTVIIIYTKRKRVIDHRVLDMRDAGFCGWPVNVEYMGKDRPAKTTR